jgi:hypothetical protein
LIFAFSSSKVFVLIYLKTSLDFEKRILKSWPTNFLNSLLLSPVRADSLALCFQSFSIAKTLLRLLTWSLYFWSRFSMTVIFPLFLKDHFLRNIKNNFLCYCFYSDETEEIKMTKKLIVTLGPEFMNSLNRKNIRQSLLNWLLIPRVKCR